ncbi:UDP-galactose-4-epimerase [Pedobacter psychrophilus]|uniref:UDP-galactose-4-epimerase n=1 Tax=Pedobacter psychrophilus TaxID=1826909 RepID=A0A179DCM2_9SPHI|nr:NAD-dependent epimerase/dehydratase family protein [Pedobacter psychrophilus]OAQ38787.1 UDP-galactose-4-epimerase [Pedobacter psychrophilus]
MKILLTGSSGFLAKQILEALQQEEILCLSRNNADISIDLSTQVPNLPISDLVIHAAGKAHSVPKTEDEIQNFFDVNVIGTKNLLKGLEQIPFLPKSFVFISSVSVYGLSKGIGIKENNLLNAKDPYGLSKIQAEKLVQDWCDKNNVICTILRLPLLVGENPPGNLGAMIKGIKKGYYMNIAGGNARKSMLLAEDVASFILPSSKVGGIYNLTDGYHPSFKELSNVLAKQCNNRKPLNIPKWLAEILAKIGDLLGERSPFNSYKLSKITADLTFDDTKARTAFGWQPQNVLDSFKINL